MVQLTLIRIDAGDHEHPIFLNITEIALLEVKSSGAVGEKFIILTLNSGKEIRLSELKYYQLHHALGLDADLMQGGDPSPSLDGPSTEDATVSTKRKTSPKQQGTLNATPARS